MAVSPLLRKCKWKTRTFINLSFPVAQSSSNCSSQVITAREIEATEKINVMEDFNKHESFAYTKNLWESLLATPHKWYDCRIDKKSENAPDFKHIDTGGGLWIDSAKTSALVKSKLISLGREAFAPPPSVEDLWKAFFADPSKWFDNRKVKRNKKFPDFKHKDTGEALWLNDKSVPAWVFTKLNGMQDEAFTSCQYREELWEIFFADPSKWLDYRKSKNNKKHPDFVHKDTGEGLWIEAITTPSWVTPMLKKLQDNTFTPDLSIETLWKRFFDDPSIWFDNRKIKKSSKHPDFKHRENGEALWIENDKNPSWVYSKLNDIRDEAFSPSESMEDMWTALFADPCKWIDYRKTKTNMFPDFRHKENGKTLRISSSKTPAWVLPKLLELRDAEFASSPSMEELWKSLFADSLRWIDYRKMKKSSKCPDFVHKETTEGLWIESMETPFWIIPMLKELPDESFATAVSPNNLWLAFFNDPSKWFDNRKTKKNSKHPDFKHEDNCKALWIEDNKTPAWVFCKLNDMWDDAYSKPVENLWKTFFEDPLKWLDCRKIKKNKVFPDFRHKLTPEALWISDKRTPAWVLPKLNDLGDEIFASSKPVEDLWISVFVEQSKWLDYRKIKKSNKHPDFMHKDTTEALWIDGINTPEWVKLMLKNLKNEAFSPFASFEHLWKSFFDDPSKWFDIRSVKTSSRQSDFVNKNTDEALWIDDTRIPNWVLPKLSDLKFEAFANHNEILARYENKWKAFFANPSKWFDDRASKKSPQAPDFRHRDTKETLWIASKWTPGWVVSKLQNELQRLRMTSR